MNAKTKVKDMVNDGKEAVTKEAEARMDDVRDDVAEHADTVSSAARKAAGEFEDYDAVNSILTQASEAVENATNRLRERSIPDLVDDVSAFARRNPLLFLGGAALAGFAAARFLSASAPAEDEPELITADEDVWSGYLPEAPKAESRD
ncbi:hypothetical protein [Roseovarius atlanticus]|uniref:hypothetical protein n=1 Tax=Roseovarius atlanticus TaxID=1641875 RepID=UPI001C95BFE9|nr:hypothetical protein [Roseovarius atlanticus]MBY5987839.1 hypothetical protein [Roseovarius atlanticus]MBY6123230.1 hypothetical protein [Roseovarius atlanticus]MBY6147726.1 hypothetical protein [Roseovarius atlanticus]